jgi:cytochrome d ubiquinol oxidase subunit II
MVASIGPFWDANETWLVLGIGILLVAFPLAHGVILGALPAGGAMLVGLILRGVAFELPRQGARAGTASCGTGSSGRLGARRVRAGLMLGRYITGFDVILIGCAVAVPAIACYTAFSYWVFRGKATALNYG